MKSHRREPQTDTGTPPGGQAQISGGFPHQHTLERSLGVDLSALSATVGGGNGAALEALGKAAATDGTEMTFAETPTLDLVAHEVAHAMFGHSGGDDTAEEAEADRIAQRIVSGEQVDLGEVVRGTSGVAFYTQNGDLRISDQGGMATSDSDRQTLWATQALIASAQGLLGALGERGSYITLKQTNDTLKVLDETLYRVALGWNGEGQKDLQGYTARNKDSDTLLLPTDCGLTAAAVMAARGDPYAHGVYTDGEDRKLIEPRDNLDGEFNKCPQWIANAIYFERMRDFIRAPGHDEYLEEGTHYKISCCKRKAIKPKNSAQARRMYHALGEQGMEAFDAFVGINRHADPEVGESYAIATGGEQVENTRTWNYHWGGVIMKDGPDNVVLESYGRGDAKPEDWDLQMHGTAKPGQSFHEEHAATNRHGTQPTTVVARRSPPRRR